MKKCRVCKKAKSEENFPIAATCKGGLDTICRKCKCIQEKIRYKERVKKDVCPICGKGTAMVSSCMCEACWFRRHGRKKAVWEVQGTKCPYSKVDLVPGVNMVLSGDIWVSKRFAVASKGLSNDDFAEWCMTVAENLTG